MLFKFYVVVAAHPNLIHPLTVAVSLFWEGLEGWIIKLKEAAGSALWVRSSDSTV